jgi:acyl-CoA thioester hydrolase
MNDRVKALLHDFPVVVPNAVAWAEMDAFRHVNNAVFFRYFENARIAYLTRIGLSDQRDDGIGPILHSTHARFRRPLRYPDVAWTGARVMEVLSDRFTMEYRIVSEQDGVIVADGGAVVVSYDYVRKEKADLPLTVRSSIDALSG